MTGGVSSFCAGAQHGYCPGYYRMTHPCQCGCHTLPASAAVIHGRLGDIELILQGLPPLIDSALALNAFRAGAIAAHLSRVRTKLDEIGRALTALDAPDGT